MKTCGYVACAERATRRGLCRRHYQRHWQRGELANLREYAVSTPRTTGPVPRFGEAACLGRDDIEWVPDRESFDEPNTRRALSVCGGCVLRVQCAEWALANHEIGLWGGTTTDERARLRRDRRQVPA